MSKNYIYTVALLLSIPVLGFSQKQYKTPVHSMGMEVSWSSSWLEGFPSNYNDPGYDGSRHLVGFGGSIVIPYQYAPKSSFFGLQSGLGFFMWGTTHQSNNSWGRETESLYFLGIPMAVQLKVFRPFWVELGVQTNFAVYNTILEAGAWNASNSQPPGSLPFAELQGIFGFRYHVYRSLSFKARVHVGLTPAYQSENWLSFFAEDTHQFRFVAFEMGLSYLFPLEK
jgi:hypothetical protein